MIKVSRDTDLMNTYQRDVTHPFITNIVLALSLRITLMYATEDLNKLNVPLYM